MNHPSIYPLCKSYDDISSRLFISCPDTAAGHHHHPCKIEHDRPVVLSKLGRKFQNLVTQHHGILLKGFPMHSNQQYLVGLE